MKPLPLRVETVMRKLARAIDDHDLPAVEKIANDSREDPFEVLISTMLSAQTRATSRNTCTAPVLSSRLS